MSEIESIRPALSVTLDDGDFIVNSIGPIGKAMAQAILPLAAGAKKVVIIQDGEMKVMKRNQAAANGMATVATPAPPSARRPASPLPLAPSGPDIQDQFVADLEAGVTGEVATGEQPSPTPGPNDPVKVSTARRKPIIYQDAAAPPAPELAEEEMSRLLEEATQAERESARVQEDQRYQAQQVVQAQVEPADAPAEAPKPRKREPRSLATVGRACGRCAGGGQIQGEAGFVGACPVCHGEGQVKTWDRSLKIR